MAEQSFRPRGRAWNEDNTQALKRTCGAPGARKRARRVREAVRGNGPVDETGTAPRIDFTTHLTAGMRRYIADSDWLTVHQLPPYAPDLNPVEGHLVRPATHHHSQPCLRRPRRADHRRPARPPPAPVPPRHPRRLPHRHRHRPSGANQHDDITHSRSVNSQRTGRCVHRTVGRRHREKTGIRLERGHPQKRARTTRPRHLRSEAFGPA